MSILSTDFMRQYPAVRFEAPGSSVSGRIVDLHYYQKDANAPALGVRIVIETIPGGQSTQVALWCQGKLLVKAVSTAFRSAGATRLTVGADLAVTFTGWSGRSKTYDAAYAATS